MDELVFSGEGFEEGHFLWTTENGTQHLVFLGRTHCDSWTRFGAPGRKYPSDGTPVSVYIKQERVRLGETVDYYPSFNRGIRDYDHCRTSHVVSIQRVRLTWEVIE